MGPVPFDVSKDIPAICPLEDCNEEVPTNSSSLVEMFRNLKTLKHHGATEVAILRQEIIICGEIKAQLTRNLSLSKGHARGWLTTINFQDLPGRILAMKSSLDEVISVKSAKERCCTWDGLIEGLEQHGMSVHLLAAKTSTMAPIWVSQMARPG
jgi:hypothetical protein